MKYEELKGLNDTKFKRAIGIKREVFEFQVAILEETQRKNIIGMYFGIDESNAYRWTVWAESVI